MREILFRGKRMDNDEWVYGSFCMDAVEQKNGPCGVDGFIRLYDFAKGKIQMHEVDRETVGQFTGLTDKDGKRIFEGDIIKIRFESDSPTNPYAPIVWYDLAQVFWSSKHFGWYAAFASGEELSMWEYDDPYDVEIVGNIHDNKEFLYGN